jgi:hypothetical protein
MPHIRLIGLVLFITAVFLAMAAAVTHTTHIRFKRYSPNPDRVVPLVDFQPVDGTGAPAHPTLPPTPYPPTILPPTTPSVPLGNSPQQPPATMDGMGNLEDTTEELQFNSVPVIYPLAIACLLGLMMWFVPAPHSRTAKKRRRRR